MMIIGRVINMKSALKWAVHVELSLHLFQNESKPRSCTNLGTPVSCDICMMLHWHLAKYINPVVLYLLEYFLRKTLQHDKVPSLLARDEDDIHNIAFSKDLIWSPVAFSSCPEYILQKTQKFPQ